jgi:hypothetical protein
MGFKDIGGIDLPMPTGNVHVHVMTTVADQGQVYVELAKHNFHTSSDDVGSCLMCRKSHLSHIR